MIYILLSLALFAITVAIHECAHGWVANRLGDPTAKFSGRLTLNPLAHIDLFGTIILPLSLVLMRSPFVIGYAKPVPINFANLKNPKKDIIWVGLAGPLANIIVAIVLSSILKITMPLVAYQVITMAIFYNLLLAFFNLIPIPPLDGSRVVFGLLPYRYSMRYAKIERYGFAIIMFAVFFLGLLDNIVLPMVYLVANLLGVSGI
ncbi:site-2 protease family protein [Candidatus Omnitrophota bacterium]